MSSTIIAGVSANGEIQNLLSSNNKLEVVSSASTRTTTSVLNNAVANGNTMTTTHAIGSNRVSLLIKLPNLGNWTNTTVDILVSADGTNFFSHKGLQILPNSDGSFFLQTDLCYSHIRTTIANATGGSYNASVVICDF